MSFFLYLLIAFSGTNGTQGFGFELTLSETLYVFEPGAYYSDSAFLKNTGDYNDVFELSVISYLPENWAVSLCVGGGCFPPGFAVLDSLSAGETDTILIDVLAPDDSSGLPSYLVFVVQSLGDTSLLDSPAIHFATYSQGVEEISRKSPSRIWVSNLSGGFFRIGGLSPSDLKGNLRLYLFDSQGRTLFTMPVTSTEGFLSLKGFPSELYLLFMRNDSRVLYRTKILNLR